MYPDGWNDPDADHGMCRLEVSRKKMFVSMHISFDFSDAIIQCGKVNAAWKNAVQDGSNSLLHLLGRQTVENQLSAIGRTSNIV